MGKELVKKVIDGHTYEFGYMNPKTSLRLLTSLLQNFGVPIGEAVGVGLKKLGDNPGGIIKNICKSLDPEKTVDYMDRILSQVIHVKGADDQKGFGEVNKCFDVLFTGNLSHMLKVAYAALEVEYSDFFGDGSVLKNLNKGQVNP
jgi:hypothetical protein